MALATLIGDVVGSRDAADRRALHTALTRAVRDVNDRLHPAIPLRITVGDEYQGGFERLGDALQATLWLRTELAGAADVRHGLGWGSVDVLEAEPRVEDGPGWWAARAAIEEVKRAQGDREWAGLRTAFACAEESPRSDVAAVQAAIIARDQLLSRLDQRGLSVLGAMLRGMTQQQIAERAGISPSAVSQRKRRDDLAVLVRIGALLGEVA